MKCANAVRMAIAKGTLGDFEIASSLTTNYLQEFGSDAEAARLEDDLRSRLAAHVVQKIDDYIRYEKFWDAHRWLSGIPGSLRSRLSSETISRLSLRVIGAERDWNRQRRSKPSGG